MACRRNLFKEAGPSSEMAISSPAPAPDVQFRNGTEDAEFSGPQDCSRLRGHPDANHTAYTNAQGTSTHASWLSEFDDACGSLETPTRTTDGVGRGYAMPTLEPISLDARAANGEPSGCEFSPPATVSASQVATPDGEQMQTHVSTN